MLVEPELFRSLPVLSGYENHAGHTVRDPGLPALGRVRAGVGNGDGTDGAVSGRVVGTYLHGPVLARNPELADLLLANVVADLPPLDDTASHEVRKARRPVARRWRRSAR